MASVQIENYCDEGFEPWATLAPPGTFFVSKREEWWRFVNLSVELEEFGARKKVWVLSDVFNPAPTLDGWRAEFFRLTQQTPNLFWICPTLWPQNILRMLPNRGVWQNLWLGVTVATQEGLDRFETLRTAREVSPVLFIDADPCLEHLELSLPMHVEAVDWVLCQGHPTKPFDLNWGRSLARQCERNGVPFFFKGTGGNPVQGHAWIPAGATPEAMDLLAIRQTPDTYY